MKVSIEHIVSAFIFQVALTEHFFITNSPFKSPSKAEGEKILRKYIVECGKLTNEENTDLLSDPYQSEYNSLYQKSKKWVNEKYPYLK